jgi:hypothetical protein
MKPIQKDELFQNLSQYLKTKGIELQEGSYTRKIHQSCTVLADAINLSQQGLEKAKAGIDRKLDQVRQVIHEKTAPKSAAKPQAAPSPAPEPNAAAPAPEAPKKARARTKKSPRAR